LQVFNELLLGLEDLHVAILHDGSIKQFKKEKNIYIPLDFLFPLVILSRFESSMCVPAWKLPSITKNFCTDVFFH